jgi:hypothetical protein
MEWNPQTENLEQAQEPQLSRLALALHNLEFEAGLGAYPFNTFQQWTTLASTVTWTMVREVQVLTQQVATFTFLDCAAFEQAFLQTVKSSYTDRKLTTLYLDKSTVCASILKERFRGDPGRLLGEIRIGFIVFLLGQDYTGFKAWQDLVGLLCSSELLMQQEPTLFEKLVTLLGSHLMQVPSDFFVDPISEGSFLDKALRDLYELLLGVSPTADTSLEALRQGMLTRFQVDIAIPYDG